MDDLDVQIKLKIKKEIEENIKKEIEEVVEENYVSNNKKVLLISNKSFCIGVVCYMEKDKYSNKEDNKDIHFPYTPNPEIYPDIIKNIFEYLSGKKIKKIVVGHEHGKENNKCHLQCCIFFKEQLQKKIYPSYFILKVNGVEYKVLYMQQKARNAYAMENYCKKEGDFSEYVAEPIDLVKNDKGKVQAFATIVKNKGLMSQEDIENLLFTYDPRSMFTNYRNISQVIPKFSSDLIGEEFQWVLPKHLDEYTIPTTDKYGEPKRVKFMPIFLKWFNENCNCGDQFKRKKALCLYSKHRSLGKTEFAKRLVNDPKYLLMFSNTFTSFDATNKKLLLLDDMAIIQNNQKEMWKNLVAGVDTTIRGCYINIEYKANLPCIITTNNLDMVYIFATDNMFNTQVVIIEVDTYMGPEGTKPDNLFKVEQYFSKKTLEKVDLNKEIKKYYEEKKVEKINNFK